jgi:four helix bundle protein
MMKTELEGRTRRFSGALVGALRGFPHDMVAKVLASQLFRAGTAIGAHYREANRAESMKDFLHKVALATKEGAEYWLELCLDAGIGPHQQLIELSNEVGQLVAILVTIGKNARKKPSQRTKRS